VFFVGTEIAQIVQETTELWSETTLTDFYGSECINITELLPDTRYFTLHYIRNYLVA